MTKVLRDYFPMIQTREEVLEKICNQEELFLEYSSWEEHRQQEFLDFCTGAQGLKITYDSFFKEIMNPEYHPERLEEILSLLIGEKVRIRQVLPNDSVRLMGEGSLVIMDIVVELESGGLANIEIQKFGYAFPGQRCACYSADLLLRQYKRVKSIRKDKFTYRDIKTVYIIVFYEQSTKEFRTLQEDYIHHSRQVFDTGLPLNLFQEFILIPLDIYKKSKQNKAIENKLEAWLAFLSFDEPEKIIELIEEYPEFQSIYEEIYDMCCNIERVVWMYSKELLELDRNTVRYMIEEQQELLNQKDTVIEKKDAALEEKNIALEEKDAVIEEKDAVIEEKDAEIIQLKKMLAELEKE